MDKLFDNFIFLLLILVFCFLGFQGLNGIVNLFDVNNDSTGLKRINGERDIYKDVLNIQKEIREQMEKKSTYSGIDKLRLYRITPNYSQVTIEVTDDGPSGIMGSGFNIIYKGMTKRECYKTLLETESKFYQIKYFNLKIDKDNFNETCNKDENELTFTSL